METGLKKNELIHGGCVRLPDGVDPDIASAGSAILTFGEHRARASVSSTEGSMELKGSDKCLSLFKEGSEYIGDIALSSQDCTGQLFFDIMGGGFFSCPCSRSPLFASRSAPLPVQEVVSAIEGTIADRRAKSLMLIGSKASDVLPVIESIRASHPKMIIGASLNISAPEEMDKLKDAGLNELQLDIGCSTEGIFNHLFPDRSYDDTISLLRHAGEIFKKRATTTIVCGLGETDQDVDVMLERICRMRVIPYLTMLRENDPAIPELVSKGFDAQPPSALRSMFLGGLHKSAMQRHGLEPSKLRTSCIACGCCEMIPFTDF